MMVIISKLLRYFLFSALFFHFLINQVLATVATQSQQKIYHYLKADRQGSSNQYSYTAAASNSEQGDDLNAIIKSSLVNYGSEKLTPSPNEDIDLYTGTFKLRYTDFSTPIAPGLNLEVNRVYDSTVYNYVNYPQLSDLWMYDINLPSWSIETSYILDRFNTSCELAQDPCDLVLVNANGTHESLRTENKASQKWITKNNSVFDGATGILIDKRGFKYYFGTNTLLVNGGFRMYLDKVETPDGKHWLKYSYRGHYLQQISSSDPNKTIDINLEPLSFYKQHQGQYSMYEPVGITFNNKRLINYSYKFFDSGKRSFGRLALAQVTKANGEKINYDYELINLKVQHTAMNPANWRLMLNNISYENGENTHYKYIDDDQVFDHKFLRNIRLSTVTHSKARTEESNTWSFYENSTGKYNGVNIRTIIVQGPYYATKMVYSHFNNEYSWQAGLPLQKIIYKNHVMSDDNMLQQEFFSWSKKWFSNRYYYVSSSIKEAGFDTITYKPLLESKTITRYSIDGQDSYKIQSQDYDNYDNPQKIILTSHDGKTKEITQTFYNNTDKNILGLRTSLAIDGHSVLSQSYDEYGQVIEENKQGKVTKYSYDNGLLSTKTDAMGNVSFYKDYLGGAPQLTENADGTRLIKTYNLDGTVASTVDANGNTTHYEYNNQELIKQIPATGASVIYDYDHANLYKYTTIDNYSIQEEYNHAGLLLSKLENNEIKKIIKYDGLGRKIFESFAYAVNANNTNHGLYYQYDSLNRLLSKCSPAVNSNCTNYYYLGNNTVKTIEPNGEYTLAIYHAYGEPNNSKLMQIEKAHIKTSITRDYLEAVTKVTQGNISKYYEYDTYHNLIKYTEPETGVTEYQYDQMGNLLEKKQNGYQKTSYNYHPQNYKLLGVNYSDVSYNETFAYDNNGNLLKSHKGNISRIYQYDAVNRLINEALFLHNIKDNNGKTTRLEVSYNYNAKGSLSGLIYPDNTVVDLQPDDFGRPTKIGDYINNIQYHVTGVWHKLDLNNGVTAATDLDNLYRINKYKYGSISLNYLYDSNHNLLSLDIRDAQKFSYNYQLNFRYDLDGRITDAHGAWGNLKYGYDLNNNITSIRNVAGNLYNSSFSYDDKMHLVNHDYNRYFYDSLGNIAKDSNYSYEYGVDGNLLNINGKNSEGFEYDTDHHRIIKHNYVSGSRDVITFYTKSGQALYEYDTKYKRAIKYIYFNNHKWVKIEDYVDNIKPARPNKPKISYYYNDSVGSPIVMADSQGKTLWHQIYQPFGTIYLDKVARKDNKHGFVGKEVDDTGLSYFGARYYNDQTARFMSVDPAVMDPEKPYTFNRYIYGNNNPYKYVDSDGRFAWMIVGTEFIIGAGTGWIAAGDVSIEKKILAACIGGATTVAASGVSLSAYNWAAKSGYNYLTKLAWVSLAETSVNTVGFSTADRIIKGNSELGKNVYSSFAGSLIQRKINPMYVNASTLNESLLYSNKSTAFTFLTSKAIDNLYVNTLGYNKDEGFISGFNSWYSNFKDSGINGSFRFDRI